jgi:3-methyladenine DNA glycosylase AlkD
MTKQTAKKALTKVKLLKTDTAGKQRKAQKRNEIIAEKLTAKKFLEELNNLRSAAELKKYERYFKFSKQNPLKGDLFIGVRMGHVFNLARDFLEMEAAEIEKLMESKIHEARAGAMSIMGKHAASKKISSERLKVLYDLYIRRHDRINNWDLVDLAAHQVVGRYLSDKPRDILYSLAHSDKTWERRTAIVSTAHFIRKKEIADTFKIAEMLLKDEEDLIHKAAGWMLRAAGDVDKKQLINFLDKHAAAMPRAMLRNALEHFNGKERQHYMDAANKKTTNKLR